MFRISAEKINVKTQDISFNLVQEVHQHKISRAQAAETPDMFEILPTKL